MNVPENSNMDDSSSSGPDNQRIKAIDWKLITNIINHEPINTDAMLIRPGDPRSSETEDEEKEDDLEIENIGEDVFSQLEMPIAYNLRALSKRARTYELEKFEKNAMIIFNHENLEGYAKRTGTDKDYEALKETFEKFNFIIEDHKDLTKVQLFNELGKFSQKDFTEYGCVAVVILTHGTNGLLRASDAGQTYRESDILNQFKTRNKPSLITKPVLLIIQACRGKESTVGVPTMAEYRINTDHEEQIESYHLPVEADMCIVHSSYAGKPSYRPNSGSWFIQTLCKHINEMYLNHDLESIVTEVKREVAIDKYYMEYNHRTNEMDVNKQMPVTTSTLLRKLYFRRFQDSPPKIQLNSLTSVESTDDNALRGPEIQTDSCMCFIFHYNYMKNCLRHFLQDHPTDSVAKELLALADFENEELNEAKTKIILKTMSNFLQTHSQDSNHYRYMYFYKGGNEADSDTSQAKSLRRLRNFINSWIRHSQNNTVRCLGTCIGAYIIYNFVRK